MITRNGLNLFKILLTHSCPDISKFTDIDSNTDYLTSHAVTATWWQMVKDYYNGSGGSLFSGLFTILDRAFMPYTQNKSEQFNYESNTGFWSTTTSINVNPNYINCFSEEMHTITIPAGIGNGQPTLLTAISTMPINFGNAYVRDTGITTASLSYINPLGIYGTAPNNLEYLTVTCPKHFGISYSLNYGNNPFGVRSMYLLANLGYSGNAESVDDYDLASPVYNKKLNPIEMSVKCLDSKIEFTIAFKNFESESISVNEFGLYNYADSYPTPTKQRISFNGYKFGSVSTNVHSSNLTLYDELYTAGGRRPNLIVRKVLPQTITIPPDGIATFKYTIDLSEMKAQENIAYKQA